MESAKNTSPANTNQDIDVTTVGLPFESVQTLEEFDKKLKTAEFQQQMVSFLYFFTLFFFFSFTYKDVGALFFIVK